MVVCVLLVGSRSVVDIKAEMRDRKDNEDVRTYMCTYVRTYICTYVHTYICTYVRTYMYIIVPVTTWYYLVYDRLI